MSTWMNNSNRTTPKVWFCWLFLVTWIKLQFYLQGTKSVERTGESACRIVIHYWPLLFSLRKYSHPIAEKKNEAGRKANGYVIISPISLLASRKVISSSLLVKSITSLFSTEIQTVKKGQILTSIESLRLNFFSLVR